MKLQDINIEDRKRLLSVPSIYRVFQDYRMTNEANQIVDALFHWHKPGKEKPTKSEASLAFSKIRNVFNGDTTTAQRFLKSLEHACDSYRKDLHALYEGEDTFVLPYHALVLIAVAALVVFTVWTASQFWSIHIRYQTPFIEETVDSAESDQV